MSHRTFSGLTVAVIAVASIAGSAQATFFSTASDINDRAFTFTGTAGAAGSFGISAVQPNAFSLVVSDNNNGAVHPAISIPVGMRAALTATWVNSFPLGGTLFQHVYNVSGEFDFYAPGNPSTLLLRCTVGPTNKGFLSVPGTANAWSSTGAILGADSYADVTYFAFPALVTALGGPASAANYGIVVNGDSSSSSGPDDFGFDLTVLNAGLLGQNVALDAQSKLPTTTWSSESSYSGSALGGIPAPAAASLLGMAGLVAARRRRN